MRLFPFLILAGSFATAGLGCVCSPGVTPCTSLSSVPIAFVGRVIRDSGPGLGSGPARMVVEEVLHGLPENAGGFEVETMAMSDCYMRLMKDERYVIFGSRDQKRADLIHNHVCAHSFRVRGSEKLLDALRASQSKTTSHLLGYVYKKRDQYGLGDIAGAGIRIVAEKNGQKLEAFSDGQGQFDFAGIAPGAWQLRVESPGFVHNSVWPEGPLEVPDRGCAFRSVSAASDGRIRGSVHDAAGQPVVGIPVQVFVFDSRGQLETLAFREAKTGADGKYEINALPAQEYVAGINAEKYHDRIAYPPLLYPQTRDRDSASRIRLGEQEQKSGIDFVVGKPRKQAVMLIEGVYEDGSAAEDFGANVEDVAGIQRAFADPKSGSGGVLRVELWAGETYRIRAWRHEVHSVRMEGNAVRAAIDEWKGEGGPLSLGEAGTRIRVVLRRVSK